MERGRLRLMEKRPQKGFVSYIPSKGVAKVEKPVVDKDLDDNDDCLKGAKTLNPVSMEIDEIGASEGRSSLLPMCSKSTTTFDFCNV